MLEQPEPQPDHQTNRKGLLFRLVAMALLELLIVGVLFLLRWQGLAFTGVPAAEVWGAFGLVLLAMQLGQVFSQYPSGQGYESVRLGLATFCRTGLPLMVVIGFSKYSVAIEKSEPIILLALFYAVGHFGGMILSVSHANSDAI